MGAELPAISAVIARLPEPEINLAAYGGIVFPLALIIESPIIMLLAASTALSKDWASYQRIRKFMLIAAALLTGLHILVAFTPLYYFVVGVLIDAPEEIIEPARLGLMVMTPWTASIAYRRFYQGILIRFNRSKNVGVGTFVRLSADLIVLAIGYWIGSISGVLVATSAVACGVISEAVYAGIATHPVVNKELRQSPKAEPELTWLVFWKFYLPLVMTQLLILLANPIGSAALSRMPLALESLAVWTVITGLVFVLRSPGTALNEVVVALLDEPSSYLLLKKFAVLLILVNTGLIVLVAATPLSRFWFLQMSALEPGLASMAQRGLWFALPLPALSVLQSWLQGTILYGRRTRGITEAVAVYLLTSLVILGIGVILQRYIGLYVGLVAFSVSVGAQTGWLYLRARPVLKTLWLRDQSDPRYSPQTS